MKSTEIENCLNSSSKTFQTFRFSSAHERASILENAASALLVKKAEFAESIRSEAGKPITLAQAEVDRAISVLKWAAAEALRTSGELLRLDVAGAKSGVGIHQRFPRGVVLGITPFNFPLNLVAHKVAPAIASGCTIIIKPSPFTPKTAQKFVDLFEPAGIVKCILANDEESAQLTSDKRIGTVSFTGSPQVGWKIKKQAPLKPVSLELGGNAWVGIHEDVAESALEKIAEKLTAAAFGYAGQSCISVQNIAIHRSHFKKLSGLLKDRTLKTPFGDTRAPGTLCGPVISSQAFQRISKSLEGYTLVQSQAGETGENVIPPTLIEVQPKEEQSDLVQKEIFGPVATLRSYDTIDQFIQSANASAYGLQLGLFTDQWSTIEKVYRESDVGGVVINDAPTTRYDHQPYGGVKQSGIGREGIKYAMEELTESKFLALSSGV